MILDDSSTSQASDKVSRARPLPALLSESFLRLTNFLLHFPAYFFAHTPASRSGWFVSWPIFRLVLPAILFLVLGFLLLLPGNGVSEVTSKV
jgi:hypothetical protein